MFATAIAAERLTKGLGNEFATHAMMIWYAETAPMGIKNMPKNLAPRLVVAVQMMHPTTLTIISEMMWIPRSLLRPDVQVTTRETRKVAIHTGAVISSVIMLLYPSVCTIVGKKYWKFCERRDVCCSRMKR